MLSTSEYLHYAKHLRAKAERIRPGDRRDRLLRIAMAWEELAGERKRRLVAKPEPDRNMRDG